MTDMDAKKEAARLVRFARSRNLLEPEDVVPAVNALLDLLQLDEPYAGPLPDDAPDSPVEMLERLLDYAAERGILPENTAAQRDLLDARIMGLLMPRQSEIVRRFRQTAQEHGIERATGDFYRLSIDANYIRMDRIKKNEYWRTATEYGELEITVNLSKPEKDPRDIAAERNLPQANYPKCLLCLENVGYAGRINHPARQNLRVVPFSLSGETWYFQYSPYVYYNEHCIVFSETHRPMRISGETFERLLQFVAQVPHYFLGSNADLPIVGGSILSHDHYQGGRHRFAMETAPVERTFVHAGFPDVRAGIVKWPMTVVRLASRNQGQLVRLADHLLAAWRSYSDESAGILAESAMPDGSRTPHNTVTPIARKNAAGEWELDLVLRNNRTTAEHPLGLFHPHEDLHHIKKENIGLIEVMGLAVLPGRLQRELRQIAGILTGEGARPDSPHHPLADHGNWIAELTETYGTALSREEAEACLREEVGRKFLRVLLDAGVFKRTEAGVGAFIRFMESAGFAAAE